MSQHVFTLDLATIPPDKSLRDMMADELTGLPACLQRLVEKVKVDNKIVGTVAIVASPLIVSILEMASYTPQKDDFVNLPRVGAVPGAEVAPGVYLVGTWRGHHVHSMPTMHEQWGHVARTADGEALGRFQVFFGSKEFA